MAVKAAISVSSVGRATHVQNNAEAGETSAVRLEIGDVAPPLLVAEWCDGEPLASFPSGRVTVVVFWGTWCHPCITSIPELSRLQQIFSEAVAIIGVSREEPETIHRFLQRKNESGTSWADTIRFRIARDEGNAMWSTYVWASGQRGIPAAFVVGKTGRLEWIGYPWDLEWVLEQVVNDRYDREAVAVELRVTKRLDGIRQELTRLREEQKWNEAIALLDSVEDPAGKSPELLSIRLTVLGEAGRDAEANATRQTLMMAIWDRAQQLNKLAWETADRGETDTALDLALKAAQRSAVLTNAKNARVLDTLARVHFERGEIAEAVHWQEQAVMVVTGPDTEPVTTTLARYRAAQKATTAAGKPPAAEGGQTDADGQP